MKKIFGFLLNRVLFFVVPFAIQIAVLFIIMFKLEEYSIAIQVVMMVLALCVVVYIINKRDNSAYKIGWIIIILVLPVFGVLFYICYGGKKVPDTLSEKIEKVTLETKGILKNNNETIEKLELLDSMDAGQSRYLISEGFPIYENTKVEYFPLGEKKWERLLVDLEKAEKYIFLQYFIISEGIMWDSILEILKRKAAEGLDVRVTFDDMGCLTTLPVRYDKTLESFGIKCYKTNPLRIYRNLTMVQNNRDHRKLAIIDGYIGYTGGINLADEYINRKVRFGHWKDNAIRLEGEAVWTMTASFIQSWMLHDDEEKPFNYYRPETFQKTETTNDGFVQPYSDSPLDYNDVGENVYINIINSATKYVYITTPYLILTSEMIGALSLAARRGVDVRIITPHIPDKKTVFQLTQSFYWPLIEEGVKIYEYTPGFIHAKTFISDDKVAVCGTINLDYRSLYLHFENAVWMYNCSCIKDMKADYDNTIEKCKAMTKEEISSWKGGKRIFQAVLRVLAPLM